MSNQEVVLTTHFWGNKYPVEYVHRLYAAIRRNISVQYRFIVVTDNPSRFPDYETAVIMDPQLTKLKGCTVRLRMFDPTWQKHYQILPGTKVMSLDIDLVITRDFTHLTKRDEEFVILQGVNATNPCPFNGSIWMFKAGSCSDIWSKYSPEANLQVPYFEFPDDQGWFHHMRPNAGAWTVDDGVYGFVKRGWTTGDNLPENACLVAFFGWRDPSKFEHIPWVAENWRV